MNLFLRLICAPSATAGLCSTCTWGTVRKGFGADEAEAFCRLIGPNSRVHYAVRECTSYCDRRAEPAVADARRYGFVTEIKLTDEDNVPNAPASTP